jgi:hypothetical protein
VAKLNRKNSQALGAYAGFSLQPTRMALLLLRASPEATVSMELFEDVGVSQKSGFLASQIKGGWSGNPVSDRSPELWKTFANWIRDVRDKKLDCTTTIFEIYVNRKLAAKLATKLSDVKTKQQAQAAAESIREDFWGAAPGFADRRKIPPTLEPHLSEVLGAGFKIFCQILPRFQLIQPEIDPLLDLHTEVSRWPTIKPETVQDLVIHM